jgi:hypothetical protein
MFAKETTVNVSTKIDKKQAQGKGTRLTILWDISEQQMQLLAQKAIVIKVQDGWRKGNFVPGSETVKASEVASGSRAVVVPMTPAEYAAHLAATNNVAAQEQLLADLLARKALREVPPKLPVPEVNEDEVDEGDEEQAA